MRYKFRVRFAGSSQSEIAGSSLRWKFASLGVGLRPGCVTEGGML